MRAWQIIPLLSLGSLLVLALSAWLGEDDLVFDVEVELAPDAIPPLERLAGGSVGGVIVDGAGAPVPGALIALVAAGRTHWTHAADDGSFELDDLPPGELELHLLARGHVPTIVRASVPSARLRLELDERIGSPPRLEPAAASDLAGRATRRESTASLAGYRLALVPLVLPTEPGRAVPRWERLSEDGRFLVRELAHASYRALLLPPSAGETFWPDLLAPLDESAVRTFEHPRAESEELLLALEAGAITGRILRQDPLAQPLGPGAPVHGALVFATPEPALRPVRAFGPATTSADGSFRLDDLPAATYRVRVLAGDAVRERIVTVVARSESAVDFGAFE